MDAESTSFSPFMKQNDAMYAVILSLRKSKISIGADLYWGLSLFFFMFSIFLCISAPWVYLCWFQNHTTNPKKLLYNKKCFLGLGLLHNIVHIWCGRDYTSRQQKPTQPGGPLWIRSVCGLHCQLVSICLLMGWTHQNNFKRSFALKWETLFQINADC